MLKKRMALFLIVSLTFSAGCWNRQEINESFITIAAGIDACPGNKLLFTEQIILPPPKSVKGKMGAGPFEAPDSLVVSVMADTATEGARKVHLRIPRAPLWQHTACYLFGEEFCRQGFNGVADWLQRNRNIRKVDYIFVARNTTVSEVLRVSTEVEKISALALVSMITVQDTNIGIYTPVKLRDFLGKMITPGVEPAVPGVEVVEEAGKKKLRLSGTAVFKKGKLVGWLNENESRGYRWLRPGIIMGGAKMIKCPVCGQPVVLDTLRAQSKIKPEIRDGEIIMRVMVQEEGNFFEQKCTHELLTPEMVQVLNREAARLIEGQIKAAVARAQELDSDIFGFGQALLKAYPREWASLEDRWEEVFPLVKIEVHAESQIRRSYLTTKTLPLRY